ncbi:hypothetical protein PC116_g27413 [Phytophthora cactorum]|nr:hypothetical protein Pcac1_g20363 [Phytophthora cactorum]KAG2876706.1 hypothetical protein PC115_g23548 [Phytophthora cactorum]KAG4037670.1 hypothetical protein PC123_g26765 [Phytophthora cactorum]KAG4224126.1 hypothetical protein PC116_g27413 [Phytophthora cactorum]
MPPGHRSSRCCSLTALLQGTGRFTALLTDNHVSGRRAPRSCSDAGIALRDVARQRPDAGCRS